MSQDFANGQRRKHAPRNESRNRKRTRQPTLHWGSFGAGIALGIAAALAGMLLPSWWDRSAAGPIPPSDPPDPTPITRFEFFDRLPNEKMSPPAEAGSAPSVATMPQAAPDTAREYLLQVGSFTRKEDADQLRDSLSQTGWHVETATVTLSSGAIRHRVVVGPFSSTLDTQRAITKLRKQDLDALVLARTSGGG